MKDRANTFLAERNLFAEKAGFNADLHPLKLIRGELNIRRIVSLNYDNSFAKYLKEVKFRQPDSGKPQKVEVSRNYEGQTARITTLVDGGLAELFDIASGNRNHVHDFLHLHGRQGISESLILTEQDYRERYLSTLDHQEGYREGLQYLLAGNPILFVGVGFREEDLTRPLRSLMLGKKTSEVNPLFSLDFNTSGIDQRIMHNYIRYGIFTIPLPLDSINPDRALIDSKDCVTSCSAEDPEEIPGGFRTQLLCDGIRQIRRLQDDWWSRWTDTPPSRTPYLVKRADVEKLFGRHLIDVSEIADLGRWHHSSTTFKNVIDRLGGFWGVHTQTGRNRQ